MLKKLKEKDLPVKLSKYEFHKDKITFLGFIISREGLAPDLKKIAALQE